LTPAGEQMADAAITELLRQGILAAKAGNARQAEQLLRQVIANDRNNEAAWLWMSSVVEDPADIVLCLENVLVINPNNEEARMAIGWAQKALSVKGAAAAPASPALFDSSPSISGPDLRPAAPPAAVATPPSPPVAGPAAPPAQEPAAPMATPLPVPPVPGSNPNLRPVADPAATTPRPGTLTPIPSRDTINCARCGYGNWKGNRACVRCGAALEVPVETVVQSADIGSGTVPKLGEYLVKYGFITQDQLDQALKRQNEGEARGKPLKLGEVLLELKAISPQRLEYAVRQQQRDFYSAFND
jgi:hypothetical protein